MNEIERRALYHLLRMNWLNEPSLAVEPWQVEDYRALSLPGLFDRLKSFEIFLDKTSFVSFADECDSPEDLTEHLIADRSLLPTQEDQIYLLVFELWRRLLSDKPSLSIICNELDFQICLYDNQELDNPFGLQDALSHFILALDENTDEGIPAEKAFSLISSFCANDIETFLYDFISEQIDEENEIYAHELLDDFDPYLGNNKWFKLLRMRLSEKSHSKSGKIIAHEILEEDLKDNDLEFNFEFLSILGVLGDDILLTHLMKQTLPLIKKEEEFQDLLNILIDYFHRLDGEKEENILKTMLEGRANISLNSSFNENDPDLPHLVQQLNIK